MASKKKTNPTEVEGQGPQLYPVKCPICGKVAEVEIPEGAAWLCCGQWWKAKSPETLEREKKSRFKMPEKQKALVDRHKARTKAKKAGVKHGKTRIANPG